MGVTPGQRTYPVRDRAFRTFTVDGSTPFHIYVAPGAAAAADTNRGDSAAAPLASVDEAIRRINEIVHIDRPIVVHLSSARHSWGVTLGPLTLQQPVVFYGDGAGQAGDDGFTVVRATAAAAAGTGLRVVVTSGLTANELRGKTIEMLDGAAAGDRRTIQSNTTTNIVPAVAFRAAPAPGDSFRVVEPAVLIEPATPIPGSFGYPYLPMVLGCGSPADPDSSIFGTQYGAAHLSGVGFFNARFVGDAAELFSTPAFLGGGQVFLAGVENEMLDDQSILTYFKSDRFTQVQVGYDVEGDPAAFLPTYFRLPFLLGLVDNAEKWAGWGAYIRGDVSYVQNLRGCVVFETPTFATGFFVERANWRIGAGGIFATANIDINGFANFHGVSRVALAGLDASLPVLVQANATSNDAAGVRSFAESVVSLRRTTVTLTGAGVAVAAGAGGHVHDVKGGGNLTISEGVTLSGVRAAAAATQGGSVYYEDPPTVAVVPSVNEIAIWIGRLGTVAVANGTFAGLSTGQALLSTAAGDGSKIMRVF